MVSIGGHHHSSVQPKQRAHDLRLGQRPEYRDLMTAASKLTGERVNRSTHNHSVRGRGAVCAGVNYCGNPGCDLVLVVRGYQIRCADIGWVTGRNVLYFWLAEELM